MPRTRSAHAVAAGALMTGLLYAGSALAEPTLTRVPPAPGEFLDATGLSPDGSAVTGEAGFGDAVTAFRWTAATGTQSIGLLPNSSESKGHALSTAGAAVVGYAQTDTGFRAFRWTAADGMQNLGTLPGANHSLGFAVNSDGSVVTGYSNANAFRWTAAGGMQSLDNLAGSTSSVANGISADGNVISGFASIPAGDRAFRWTATGGMQSLGTLAGDTRSVGIALSADGSTVAGYSASTLDGTDNAPFRWTAATGMQPLPTLPGTTSSSASAVSGDGLAIVGSGNSPTNGGAFLWTPSLGTVDLNDYLPSLGIDLDGWHLNGAPDISDDGSAILLSAHRGADAAGFPTEFAAFVVTGIPEPSAAATLAAAGLVGSLMRRRRRHE